MKRFLAGAGLVVWLLTCLGLGGCERQQGPSAQKGPPEVFVSAPVSREITDYEEFSGRLESDQTIQIRARVTGYLMKQNFKEGGEVEKGQILFEIDPQLYEAELALAEGNVGEAQGQYDQAKADWSRAQQLRNNEISPEQRTTYKGAYVMSEGKLKAAKASLKKAQVNMSYTKVRAPLSGRISKTAIDPGNLVKGDDTVLTSIGSVDPIKAYFDVDERTVLRVLDLIEQGVLQKDPTGLRVEMGLADEEDRSHVGKIDFFDTYVDQSTGTLRVRGSFDNKKGLFVPGMFVRVRLPIGKAQKALLVAEKALVTDQGQKFVYVVKDENSAEHEGKVEYRRVELGRLHDGLRVIRKGLEPNEKVVVSGLQRVRPDITVKFKDVEMPVSAPTGDSLDPSKSRNSPSATPSRSQPGTSTPTTPKNDKRSGKKG